MAFFFSLRLPIGDQNRGAPSRGPSSWTFALTIFKRSSRGLLGALRRGTRQRIHLGELRSRLRKIGASTQESFRPLGGALSWPFSKSQTLPCKSRKSFKCGAKSKASKRCGCVQVARGRRQGDVGHRGVVQSQSQAAGFSRRVSPLARSLAFHFAFCRAAPRH